MARTQTIKLDVSYTTELRALLLWAELLEKLDGNYTVFHEYATGDEVNTCFFCDEGQPRMDEKHKPDCVYLRVKELMSNIEKIKANGGER